VERPYFARGYAARSSASGPLGPVPGGRFVPLCVGPLLLSLAQFKSGPGPEAIGSPSRASLAGFSYQPSRLVGGLWVWSNPSLQRTRLRSPLNSISLGRETPCRLALLYPKAK